MNPFERLDYYKNTYTKSESSIYEWIKANPNALIKHSIDALAKETHTSKAAVIRFSKKIGYNGFAEFKFELSRFIISGERNNNQNEEMDTVKSITALYSGFIKQINDFVDLDKVKEIAQRMSTSSHIKIIGRNRTSFSALQLRYRLTKIGLDAEAISDDILLIQVQEYLTENDLVIIFTTRAADKYYYDLCRFLKQNHVTTVIISCSDTNLLKLSDYHILLPSIANASISSFLDDQAIMFVFIEILLAELAYSTNKIG